MKLFLAFKFVFKLQKLVKINMIKWKGLEKKYGFKIYIFPFFKFLSYWYLRIMKWGGNILINNPSLHGWENHVSLMRCPYSSIHKCQIRGASSGKYVGWLKDSLYAELYMLKREKNFPLHIYHKVFNLYFGIKINK